MAFIRSHAAVHCSIGSSIDAIVPQPLQSQLDENVRRLLAGERIPIAETYRLRGEVEIEIEESMFFIPGGAERPPRIASIAREIGGIGRLRRAAELLSGARQETHADRGSMSPAMQSVLKSADMAAEDRFASVLLLGETGAGKSWLARSIHQKSPRAERAFVEINCASLAPQLLESELFGHERGAFTGASTQKRGLVEAADGGTLFLDEVGELSASVQAQLLTFLDTKTFRRVGGTRMLHADVRLLAATNVDLKLVSSRGGFRRDLYYRLSVVPIEVPPLRERREDIPQLARALAHELARRVSGGRRIVLNKRVLAALAKYDWPGNVRELRNALERAIILGRGGAIELDYLPSELRTAVPGATSQKLDDVERGHILRVLEACENNRTRAAEVLDISRSTMKRKLAEYGIRDDE